MCGGEPKNKLWIYAKFDLALAMLGGGLALIFCMLAFALLCNPEHFPPDTAKDLVDGVLGTELDEMDPAMYRVLQIICGIMVVALTLGMLLEFFLFRLIREGIFKRDHPKCKRWLMIRIAFFALALISTIKGLMMGEDPICVVITLFLVSLYNLPKFFLATMFLKELADERNRSIVQEVYLMPPTKDGVPAYKDCV